MLCTNCKLRNANFHYKQVINGQVHEANLCEECAKSLGYLDQYHDPFDFGGLLNEFLGIGVANHVPSLGNVCDKCGTDFETFRTTGLIGCENCYDRFSSYLDSMLPSIQAGTVHKGKKSIEKADSPKKKIDSLKSDLKKAIKDERYEDAAKIRDEIKMMEGENKNE